MHIIIGGAYNGKKAYVEKLLPTTPYHWVDCSADDRTFSMMAEIPKEALVIIEHIDSWLERTDLSEMEAVRFIMDAIKNREVIFILTDIGRGIVPMNTAQRSLRDACGRLYQQLVAQADEVTRVWYGLPQTIKKRGESI